MKTLHFALLTKNGITVPKENVDSEVVSTRFVAHPAWLFYQYLYPLNFVVHSSRVNGCVGADTGFRVYCNSISNSKRSVVFLNLYSRIPVTYIYIGLLPEVGEAGFAVNCFRLRFKYAPSHQENSKTQNQQHFSPKKDHHSLVALGLT